MKTTIDPIFGLEWSETKGPMNLDEAHEYAESLGDGWRPPTFFELSSMFDQKSGKALIDEFVQSGYYWSSTTYAPGTSAAWGVFFNGGSDLAYHKTASGYVRCVRGGQKFENLLQYKKYLQGTK